MVTLTEEQIRLLNGLPAKFCRALREAFPTLACDLDPAERRLCIPPKHPAFGDIYFWLRPDEIVVGIGSCWHTHCGIYSSEPMDRETAENRVVKFALELLQAILEDRLVLRVTYIGNEVVKATVQYRDNPQSYCSTAVFPSRDRPCHLHRRLLSFRRRERVLSWSGPIRGKTTLHLSHPH